MLNKNFFNIKIIIIISLFKTIFNRKEFPKMPNMPNLQEIHKKTKILSCMSLSRIYIKQNENFINNIIKNLEASNNELSKLNSQKKKEFFLNVLLVNCYEKITDNQAQKLMIELNTQKDKFNIMKSDFKDLLNINPYNKFDIQHIESVLKEINKLMENMKKDEKRFQEMLKDKNFTKNFNDTFKNKDFMKNYNKLKEGFPKKKEYKKKERETNKKPVYSGMKWEEVKIDENYVNVKLSENIGLNTIVGMLISSLLIMYLFKIPQTVKEINGRKRYIFTSQNNNENNNNANEDEDFDYNDDDIDN